jgi:hypothetical protein
MITQGAGLGSQIELEGMTKPIRRSTRNTLNFKRRPIRDINSITDVSSEILTAAYKPVSLPLLYTNVEIRTPVSLKSATLKSPTKTTKHPNLSGLALAIKSKSSLRIKQRDLSPPTPRKSNALPKASTLPANSFVIMDGVSIFDYETIANLMQQVHSISDSSDLGIGSSAGLFSSAYEMNSELLFNSNAMLERRSSIATRSRLGSLSESSAGSQQLLGRRSSKIEPRRSSFINNEDKDKNWRRPSFDAGRRPSSDIPISRRDSDDNGRRGSLTGLRDGQDRAIRRKSSSRRSSQVKELFAGRLVTAEEKALLIQV